MMVIASMHNELTVAHDRRIIWLHGLSSPMIE